tara:strand:+ start:311 stop:715 length:405 start_codon:yes stop_codon:yes gene_type:complete
MKKNASFSKDRNFGLGISFIFLIIYFFSLQNFDLIINKYFIIFIFLFFISILKPNLLHLINFGVFKIGLLFMQLLSSLNIFIIYFIIIGVIGLIMKLFRYDPLFLNKKKIKKSQSFWKNRKQKYDSLESMKNQF